MLPDVAAQRPGQIARRPGDNDANGVGDDTSRAVPDASVDLSQRRPVDE